jgi:hypothetical protein
MTGYTYEDKSKFGFFDWTEIAREEYTSQFGCDYYEECPCCTCDEDVVAEIVYARPRWSKSGKRLVEETDVVWRCVSHS